MSVARRTLSALLRVKIYLVYYRIKGTSSEVWEDMELSTYATTPEIAESKARRFLDRTYAGRSWVIVRISAVVD
jgi:hypothetical protein